MAVEKFAAIVKWTIHRLQDRQAVGRSALLGREGRLVCGHMSGQQKTRPMSKKEPEQEGGEGEEGQNKLVTDQLCTEMFTKAHEMVAGKKDGSFWKVISSSTSRIKFDNFCKHLF